MERGCADGFVSKRVSFCTISCGEWGFGVKKGIFRHHFLWRVGIRCQIEYFSAPFLVASGDSVLNRVSFGTISCVEWGLVSKRVSFGTISCGEWEGGVK